MLRWDAFFIGDTLDKDMVSCGVHLPAQSSCGDSQWLNVKRRYLLQQRLHVCVHKRPYVDGVSHRLFKTLHQCTFRDVFSVISGQRTENGSSSLITCELLRLPRPAVETIWYVLVFFCTGWMEGCYLRSSSLERLHPWRRRAAAIVRIRTHWLSTKEQAYDWVRQQTNSECDQAYYSG